MAFAPRKAAPFSYKITGIQETITRLQTWEKKFRQKTLRQAGNDGSKIALKALKAIAPKQTGTWAKSLGRKVAVKDGLRLWYGVGPRSSYHAMVTFRPKEGKIDVQAFNRVKQKGKDPRDKLRGKQRTVKAKVGGSVRVLKKSKRGPDGSLALFWTDKTGKVRAMPLTRRYRPVLYSHLIEKGTKQGGRAHRMIQRASASSRAAQEAAVHRVLSDAAREV